jgi:hypothetical protein
MLSDEYIAGFFDGEGCVDIRYMTTHGGRYNRFTMRCTISQVYRKPLEMIQDRFGGSISPRRNGNIHYYVLEGLSANRFLETIRPHLIVKADEADVALEFCELVKISKANMHVPGQHRIAKESSVTRDQKILCFKKIRQLRADKGLASKARKEHNFG